LRADDPAALSALEPTPSATVDAPSARRTKAVAALALAAFSLNLNTNVLGALLPFVREAMGLDESQGKHLLAAAAYGSALGALAFDRLARRRGRRPVLVGGLAVFVVASLLHAVPLPFLGLLVLRALSGAAVGVAYAAASAAVADLAPYARRGAVMGWFNAGMFLAIPLGMPLSVAFARAGYWPGVFLAQAAVAALGWWWARREVPAGEPDGARPALWTVLKNGAAGAGLLATLLHVGSFFTTVQLATTWLDRSGRLAKEDQMVLWIGLGLASVAGSALFGRVADAFGKRNFVLVTSALLVGCFLMLAQEPEGGALLALGAVLAVVASARTGPLQALVSGTVPAAQWNALMSLRGCAMQLGVGTFAVVAAPLAARLGFRGVLFLAAAWQFASYVAIRLWVREGK
jgi:MFS transporter, DHA1 family, inner membrane transport protein